MKREDQYPDVLFSSIDEYEFGGFQLDKYLDFGYTIYIPNGIHCNFLKAITESLILMQNLYEECEKNIKEISDYKDMHGINSVSIEDDKLLISSMQKTSDLRRYIKVFEKLKLLEGKMDVEDYEFNY